MRRLSKDLQQVLQEALNKKAPQLIKDFWNCKNCNTIEEHFNYCIGKQPRPSLPKMDFSGIIGENLIEL